MLPVIRADRNIFIDADRMKELIKEKTKLTQTEFAAEIGRSKKYISNMHGKTSIPDYVFNIICKRLEVEPDYLIWKESSQNGSDNSMGTAMVAAISNLADKLQLVFEQNKQTQKMIESLERSIGKILKHSEEIKETQDTVLRKANANTVQLERLKESMLSMSETEYDRAKQFLQDVLSEEGRIEGTVLLTKADAACIKRSELMKARKDMNIQIKTVGYGKNQNAWWMKG